MLDPIYAHLPPRQAKNALELQPTFFLTRKVNLGLLSIDGLNTDCHPEQINSHPELDSGSAGGCATINTTTGPLKLQSDGLNSVDILAGKVTIEPSGNMKIEGEITIKKLNIDTTDVASASLGEGIIKAGENKIIINSKSVTSKSKIFVTPTSEVDSPLIVIDKKAQDSFTVKVKSPVSSDVKFDWWIIN